MLRERAKGQKVRKNVQRSGSLTLTPCTWKGSYPYISLFPRASSSILLSLCYRLALSTVIHTSLPLLWAAMGQDWQAGLQLTAITSSLLKAILSCLYFYNNHLTLTQLLSHPYKVFQHSGRSNHFNRSQKPGHVALLLKTCQWFLTQGRVEVLIMTYGALTRSVNSLTSFAAGPLPPGTGQMGSPMLLTRTRCTSSMEPLRLLLSPPEHTFPDSFMLLPTLLPQAPAQIFPFH